jgi:glyoxylase-like metal-dependent hydrolase (beta-lactamase superfamily II)
VKAFPDAKVVATAEVVKHIEATQAAKLAFWGPQMKDGAPKQLYVPQQIEANTFTIDGEKVEIRQAAELCGVRLDPGEQAILGGTGVAWGMHVWTADTQSAESRLQWRKTLDDMAALHPQQVIPGHYLGTPPAADRAIAFTRDYLQQFEQALKTHKDSAGVIADMKQRWPQLAEVSSLELSAKVNTGEMKW